MIERVFSRLYKYLQFKSTTTEVFQRHINIDSGYKYLTSESIVNSDNANGRVSYYNDKADDAVSYLRYLNKIKTYETTQPYAGFFTPAEKTVLTKFIKILGRKEMDYVRKVWNLCPLCSEESNLEYQTPRGAMVE